MTIYTQTVNQPMDKNDDIEVSDDDN